MTKPILDCPCVMPCISQRIATGVPEHVDVNLEREACALGYSLDQAIDGIGGERGTALGLEYIATAGLAL